MSIENSRDNVEPIFATPFASLNTNASELFNTRLGEHCESLRRVSGIRADRKDDALHFRSPPTLLATDNGPTSELRRLILGNATRTVESLNSFTVSDKDNLRVDARAWCSIVQPKGHISSQHFSGASWLAVYCVQAGDHADESGAGGVLRIHETRLSSVYRDASTWDLAIPYRYGHYSWSPRPGWMALFPAHIQHEVSVVTSNIPLVLVFALLRFLAANSRDNRYG